MQTLQTWTSYIVIHMYLLYVQNIIIVHTVQRVYIDLCFYEAFTYAVAYLEGIYIQDLKQV